MPEYNILEKRPSKSFQKVNWGGVLLDIKKKQQWKESMWACHKLPDNDASKANRTSPLYEPTAC